MSSAPACALPPNISVHLDISLAPILIPSDCFTLAPIKTGEDYLQQCNVLLFWLQADSFSIAHLDNLLITVAWNALASQFWEG